MSRNEIDYQTSRNSKYFCKIFSEMRQESFPYFLYALNFLFFSRSICRFGSISSSSSIKEIKCFTSPNTQRDAQGL